MFNRDTLAGALEQIQKDLRQTLSSPYMDFDELIENCSEIVADRFSVLIAKYEDTEDQCDQCGAKREIWQWAKDNRCPNHANPHKSCDGRLRRVQ